jgi:putative transposase
MIVEVVKHREGKVANLREVLRQYRYEYIPIEGEDKTKQVLVCDSEQTVYFIPYWWETVHNRVIRGAVENYLANHKSASSNYKAGDNKGFEMRYKKKNNILYFDDFCFPAYLKKIKAFYCYHSTTKRNCSISFTELVKEVGGKSCRFKYDPQTNQHFILYPVPVDYFPKGDRRASKNQVSEKPQKEIALDPGVRKFLTGYSPDNKVTIVGQGAGIEMTKLLHEIEIETKKVIREKLWARLKNRNNDLHWKTIKHFTDNYGQIIMGDIKTQGMIKDTNKIPRITKRLLNQFAFYQFKSRLSWKCSILNRELWFIHEAYTTKDCTCCGNPNEDIGRGEIYNCSNCGICIDRDYAGARSIFLKFRWFVIRQKKLRELPLA